MLPQEHRHGNSGPGGHNAGGTHLKAWSVILTGFVSQRPDGVCRIVAPFWGFAKVWRRCSPRQPQRVKVLFLLEDGRPVAVTAAVLTAGRLKR